MTEDEFNRYVVYKEKVVREVLTWLVSDIAFFKFHNSANYKNALKQIGHRTVIGGRNIGNYHLKKMSCLFNFDKRFITFLCGGQHSVTAEDGKPTRKRIAGDVLDRVKSSSRYIKYIGKRDFKTKSGNRFSHLGWWKLTDEGIAKVFESGELLDKSSDFYCEESKFIISKIAFHYAKLKTTNLDALEKKNNNEDNMTKAEKEKLKKECEEGKHGLPYDYLVRQIEKKEKQNLKTLHTRIMKLTQKAMFEIVEENKRLKAENEQLTAENKRLSDLNIDIPVSEDIPDSEEDHKLSFDEYCDLINAADDPGTFTYNIPDERLSEECKKQCIEGSLPDDIPEEDDVADKLEAIGHTFTEIENQKKSAAQHPADDIPEEAPAETAALSEEKHYSKVIPRLQEFVNKCYISKREADRFALIAKENITIKESRTGYSFQDREAHRDAREKIMRQFISEFGKMFDAKDWKWANEFMA